MPGPLVSVERLCRVYQVGDSHVHALAGIDLDIQEGEFLAVVGVSGSGKSTLLHLIGGLDTPSSGGIRVAGRQLEQLSKPDRSLYRRQCVGFVFQSFYLVPSLTAQANLHVALTFQGIFGQQRRRLAKEALRRVGLEARTQHRPGQLSGGEQKRVCVARAIVHRPRLLLADEPTGNLDQKTAEALLDLIRTIQQESDTTVVMVTHNEELAGRYCDRTIRMVDGRLRD